MDRIEPEWVAGMYGPECDASEIIAAAAHLGTYGRTRQIESTHSV
jgi:hypothetical protein